MGLAHTISFTCYFLKKILNREQNWNFVPGSQRFFSLLIVVKWFHTHQSCWNSIPRWEKNILYMTECPKRDSRISHCTINVFNIEWYPFLKKDLQAFFRFINLCQMATQLKFIFLLKIQIEKFDETQSTEIYWLD